MNLEAIRQDFQQNNARVYFNTAFAGFPARSVWEKTLDYWQRYTYRRESEIFEFGSELDAMWRSAAARLLNAMENFLRLGVQEIEEHVLGLSGYCMERISSAGHHLRSVPERAHRSGNVSFRPRREVPQLLGRMENRSIFFCERGGGYRVSLHLYNSREEIDRLIDALDEECG